MPQFWSGGVFSLAKPDLHRLIAIGGNRLDLSHGAGASLNDRDRNGCPLGAKDLGHPQFFTQESTEHILSPRQRQTLGARDRLLPASCIRRCSHSSWHQRVKDVSHLVSITSLNQQIRDL